MLEDSQESWGIPRVRCHPQPIAIHRALVTIRPVTACDGFDPAQMAPVCSRGTLRCSWPSKPLACCRDSQRKSHRRCKGVSFPKKLRGSVTSLSCRDCAVSQSRWALAVYHFDDYLDTAARATPETPS